MGESEVERAMELHDKLYNLRKKNGYTQSELAEILDVSRQSISTWELGTIKPSTSRLKKLSELYSVPLETLLNDGIEVQRHPRDIKESENLEEHSALSPFSKDEDKGKKKYRPTKRIIIIAVISAILIIAIGITGYSIAATNAAKEKTQLEALLNEEITVPSENSFDLTF